VVDPELFAVLFAPSLKVFAAAAFCVGGRRSQTLLTRDPVNGVLAVAAAVDRLRGAVRHGKGRSGAQNSA